jgi:hypothetical protein
LIYITRIRSQRSPDFRPKNNSPSIRARLWHAHKYTKREKEKLEKRTNNKYNIPLNLEERFTTILLM